MTLLHSATCACSWASFLRPVADDRESRRMETAAVLCLLPGAQYSTWTAAGVGVLMAKWGWVCEPGSPRDRVTWFLCILDRKLSRGHRAASTQAGREHEQEHESCLSVLLFSLSYHKSMCYSEEASWKKWGLEKVRRMRGSFDKGGKGAWP